MDEGGSQRQFHSRLKVNLDPKLNAAADFAARLLDGPLGDRVARIQLFGSVAQNRARPDSDVDVMVFAAAPAEERSDVCAQAAWDASVQWGEQIAQLTYSLSDFIQPRSYLVFDTLRRGREIYSMEEEEIRRLEIDGLYRKAQNYLAQAEHAFDQGDYELAIVGAYNLVELAAKALILLKPDLELPSSHGGMLQTFSREYVKTGEVPAEWGRHIGRFLELRSRALYDTHAVISEGETQSMIDLVRSMIAFLHKRLG